MAPNAEKRAELSLLWCTAVFCLEGRAMNRLDAVLEMFRRVSDYHCIHGNSDRRAQAYVDQHVLRGEFGGNPRLSHYLLCESLEYSGATPRSPAAL